MLDTLKERLKAAKVAVQEAEEHIQEVTERSPERLARQHLDQRQADLASVELELKLHELAELDVQIGALLAEKSRLHQRIRGKLSDLVPDLERLDNVEQMGSQLSSTAFNLAHDTRQPLKSSWRDPKLAGVSQRIHTWLTALANAT